MARFVYNNILQDGWASFSFFNLEWWHRQCSCILWHHQPLALWWGLWSTDFSITHSFPLQKKNTWNSHVVIWGVPITHFCHMWKQFTCYPNVIPPSRLSVNYVWIMSITDFFTCANPLYWPLNGPDEAGCRMQWLPFFEPSNGRAAVPWFYNTRLDR